MKLVVFITHIFLNGRDKSRQTNILKKSTTTLSLQNMFRSINDRRQLQVLHDEFEFQLKLQCKLTLLQCREKFKLPGNVTTRLSVNKTRANTFFSGKHFSQEKLRMCKRNTWGMEEVIPLDVAPERCNLQCLQRFRPGHHLNCKLYLIYT